MTVWLVEPLGNSYILVSVTSDNLWATEVLSM